MISVASLAGVLVSMTLLGVLTWVMEPRSVPARAWGRDHNLLTTR
jgi:hypothetical protein